MSRTYRPGDRLRDRDDPNEEVVLVRRTYDDPETWVTHRFRDGVRVTSWEIEPGTLDEFYEPLEPADTITLELTRDKAEQLLRACYDGDPASIDECDATMRRIQEALDA